VITYLVYVVCVVLPACRGSTVVKVKAKCSFWGCCCIGLLSSASHHTRVGFMFTAHGVHLYSWRVERRTVCVVERLRCLMYLEKSSGQFLGLIVMSH
jgi:hypothetical protein